MTNPNPGAEGVGLGSFDPSDFKGNPDPPPKVPDAPSISQSAPGGAQTSAGTGALPPTIQAGASPLAPASDSDNNTYSVVRGQDGRFNGFIDSDKGPQRVLTLNGPEASRALHSDDAEQVLGRVASYDEATKTWRNVPEETIKALAQGRPTPAEYWTRRYNASEAQAVMAANAKAYVNGDMDESELAAANHLPTLQAQLADRPDMAWFGKAGLIADAIGHPRRAGEDAEDMGVKTAIAALDFGKSFVPVLKGALTGGVVKGFFDMGYGQSVSRMVEQGYDRETVKKFAPIEGGISAFLNLAGFETMPILQKATMLDKMASSSVVQKALANWFVKSAAGGAAVFGGVSGAQQAVSEFLNYAAAHVANRPDLLHDPKTAAQNILSAAGSGLVQGTIMGGTTGVAGHLAASVGDFFKSPENLPTGGTRSPESVPSGRSLETSPAGSPEQTTATSERPPSESSGETPGAASTLNSSSRESTWSITDNPALRNTPLLERREALVAEEAKKYQRVYGVTADHPEMIQWIANASKRYSDIMHEGLKQLGEATKGTMQEAPEVEGQKRLFQGREGLNFTDSKEEALREAGGDVSAVGALDVTPEELESGKIQPRPEGGFRAAIEIADRTRPLMREAGAKPLNFPQIERVLDSIRRADEIVDISGRMPQVKDIDELGVPNSLAARLREAMPKTEEAQSVEPPAGEPPPGETAPPPGAGEPDEGGRRYFKSPEEISKGVTEESTGKNLRDEYLGYYREQVARGNQLVRRFEREVPNALDRAAIVHFADAGGDLSLIAEAAHDEKIAPEARAAYERALNLSPEAQKWARTFKQFYAEAAQVGEDSGVLRSTRENYFNRVYQPDPDKMPSGVESSGNLRPGTSHARERTFDTLYDAYKAGMKPASTDASDLVRTYNNTMAKAVGSRALLDSMDAVGVGGWKVKQPSGWDQVGDLEKHVPLKDADGKAIITDTGDQAVSNTKFYAPKELARSLRAVTEPDLLRRIPGVDKAMEYQGVAKTLNLGFSLFHDLSEAAQSLAAGPAGWRNFISPAEMSRRLASPEFEQQELDAIREGKLTSPIEHDNADFLKKVFNANPTMMDKIREVPGVKQALEFNDKHVESLFGKTVRFVKVNLFTQQKLAWMGEHPDATVGSPEYKQAMLEIGKHVNDVYGGQNWASRGVTKTGLAVMRLALLAPDWVVSNLNQVRDALGGAGESTRLSRYHLATGALISTVALEGMNKIMTGHFTDKNPKGHGLEVELAPDVYFSPFRGAPHDALTLLSMLRESGAAGAARFASGKGGPISRLVFTLGSGYQWNGLPVSPKEYKKGSWESKVPKAVAGTYDELAAAMKAGGPAPFGAVNTYDYWKEDGRLTLLGLLAVASGIGRYSKPPKEKGRSGGGKSPVDQFASR